ncbi:MAG: protein-L-isoaspartate(D-aspartate) O-methyltransferase [Bacteroidales bacterium]|nr:protein-L-isoaspartate(D-aspartate) O-methyltransferase [Bacteroidales bacterium]MCF8334106.1 protein-L-isoaspartate(D-aspartate) O-methyltransferase [Bacteroidales bacterium]
MVRKQIESRGIKDERVLKVMENTPRHKFVPGRYSKSAYDDSPLPIGKGQTISQPYIVALMTTSLDIQGSEKVLEIGTGSGYQAAILAQLVKEVYTIEVIEELANMAEGRLKKMGYENVHVKWGDGYKGWPDEAPFDRIIVTAAPERIPQALIEQLKPGGKMVLPVGDTFQLLKVVSKTADGKIKKNTITGVRFVPMIHPDEPIPPDEE